MMSLLKKLLADCFKTFNGQPEDWTVSGLCHLYCIKCGPEMGPDPDYRS